MATLGKTLCWPIIALWCACAVTSCVLGDFKKGNGVAGQGGSAGASVGAGTSGADGNMRTDGGSGGSGGGHDGSGDACLGATCENPPANTCEDSAHLRAYDTTGSCVDGVCSYVSQVVECDCSENACATDPCGTVTCQTPPAPSCPEARTRRTFASKGTCDGGSCSYTSVDLACESNETCSGGECVLCKTRASCGPDCTPCSGDNRGCKDLGTSSECVGCVDDRDCGTGTCIPSTKTCVSPRCLFLDSTCGDGTQDCCLPSSVDPEPYNRGNDALYPATLSEFSMERFEVTVGRFRAFVGQYSQMMIPASEGRHVSNESDLGWDTAWNQYLPEDAQALSEAVKCDASSHTWTDSPSGNENKPINCVTWYEAYAFCVWDHGRLPTEAEWNYFAAAGSEQYTYPWGNTAPQANAERAAYGGYYYGTSALDGVLDIAPVGSIVNGYGFGLAADLAGNVAEWVKDTFEPYQVPCIDCANLSTASGATRVVRGGDWSSNAASLSSAQRSGHAPETRSSRHGFRCGRT